MFAAEGAAPIGRTVGFISAKGGAGGSTIAHNVAWAISQALRQDTLILDMDLAFGTAGLNFNQDPPHGIADALGSNAKLDQTMLDRLASKAANQEDPKVFDAAAKALGLTPSTMVAIEKEPLTFAGRYVPSVSAWAFSGVRVGETSDLFDSPEAYYIARLDSLSPSGTQSLAEVREDIKRRLAREKRIEKLRPLATQLLDAARTGTLESAAAAQKLTVESSVPFTRVDVVTGLGQFSQAIGAAFTIPIGQVGGPVATADGMAVMRVNRRTETPRAAFETQKGEQRAQLTQQLRQQRVEEYMGSLRESVKVEDHRAKVNAQLRKQAATI